MRSWPSSGTRSTPRRPFPVSPASSRVPSAARTVITRAGELGGPHRPVMVGALPMAADAADGAAGDEPAWDGSAAAWPADAQPPVTPATIAAAAIAAIVAGEAGEAGAARPASGRLARNVILTTPITALSHYVNSDIVESVRSRRQEIGDV